MTTAAWYDRTTKARRGDSADRSSPVLPTGYRCGLCAGHSGHDPRRSTRIYVILTLQRRHDTRQGAAMLLLAAASLVFYKWAMHPLLKLKEVSLLLSTESDYV